MQGFFEQAFIISEAFLIIFMAFSLWSLFKFCTSATLFIKKSF